jgi:hypothetical protein
VIEWDGRRVDFPLLDRTMVAFGANDLTKRWQHSTIPRVVKTHKRYWRVFGKARGAIGVIRDPRDVMVSYYHFKRDRKRTYHRPFAEFIRDRQLGLKGWFEHYASWSDHWVHVVSYESLKDDVFREFSRVLKVLEVRCSQDEFCEAIRRSTAMNVRQVDEAPDGDSSFARNGSVGQWVDYFSDEDRAYYRELAQRFQVSRYPPESYKQAPDG